MTYFEMNCRKSERKKQKHQISIDFETTMEHFSFRSVNDKYTYKPTYIHKNIPDYMRK